MQQRTAIGVTYEGANFSGWQRQSHQAKTIQAAVELALSQVAAHPVQVQCAGRTDAGVHALYQVCHFDTSADRNEKAWVLGSNTHLPEEIALQWAVPVDAAFHARYSAQSRTYRYLVYRGRYRSSLWARQSLWVHRPLDVAAMQLAANCLIGEQDFSAFRAAGCQAKHAIRCVEAARLTERGPFICLEIRANAFLQHMVRNIMGSLLKVGLGERDGSWFASVLAGRDRRLASVTAPPQGLFFTDVVYPVCYGLPCSKDYQGFLTWFQ